MAAGTTLNLAREKEHGYTYCNVSGSRLPIMNSAATQSVRTEVPKREPAALPELVPAPADTTAEAPFLRTRRSTSLAAAPIPLDARVALLRQYGTSGYAYAATLQPDIERYGDERGFLAYRMVGKTALVLADPIAPPQVQLALIDRFVREKGDVAFWCATRPTAEIVARMGFFVNEMGPENRLDLDGYNFSGRSKRALRQSINRAAKLGHVTRECSFKSLDSAQVKAVSDAWREQRTVRTREVSFLNRPIVFEDEMDVRKFFTFDADGMIIAFSSYDPVYEAGRIVGYCNHIKRRLPETDSLAANAMTCHAIMTFQKEGLKWLLLGISPFADIKGIDDEAFQRSWWVRRCFRTAYRNPLLNRLVYPLRSLHEHKRQYCGITEQTYYATNRRPSLRRILKVLRACGVV
jgi:lysylphosphatidylglycerol synthetase-like protein (DUF2156 family)